MLLPKPLILIKGGGKGGQVKGQGKKRRAEYAENAKTNFYLSPRSLRTLRALFYFFRRIQ